MNFLDEHVFGEPTYTYGILAIAGIVLFVRWYYGRTRGKALAIAIPIVLAGVVMLCDRLVETDREQIVAATEALAGEFSAGGGRFAVLQRTLADGYRGYGGDKADVLELARSQRASREIQSVSVSEPRLKITGKHAEMDVTSVIHLGGRFSGTYALAWKVFWIKTPAGWRIDEAKEPNPTMPGFGG